MQKAKAQIKHAKNRLYERYLIMPTNDVFKSWVKQIQEGKAEFIDRQSNRITRFWVDYDENKIPVVYDKKRKTIVTVLDKKMIGEKSE